MSDVYDTARPLSELPDDELAARIQAEAEQDDQFLGEWRQEARDAFDFVAGHQWSAEDLKILEEQQRPAVTFNRTAPMVDAVCGAQVNNRQEIKILPRSGDDGGKAEVRNLTLQWVRDNTDAEDEESEAFRDAATCGLGVIYTCVSTEDEPTGEVKMERIDPFEFGWDRNAQKANLADATRFWRRRYLDPEYVRARWPEFAEAGVGLPIGMSAPESRRKTGDQYAGEGEGINAQTGGITVTHFQWCEPKCIYYVTGPLSGEPMELTQAEWDALVEREEAAADLFEHTKRLETLWFEAVECGGKIAERKPAPYAKSASYHVITARRDRRHRRFYGLVRAVMDPQRWANKWLAQSMHILNTSAKSGVVVEEGAVANIRQFEENYAKAGSVSVVRAGMLNSIRDKVAPGMPAGFAQMMQFALAAIPDVTGINKEMLGTVGHEQAGVLEAQRKQAAQAVLAPLFDSLRRYYKGQGRFCMELVRKYVSPDTMARIVAPDGSAQAIPMAIMQDVGKYDIIVDQAPMSPNQKTEVWQVLQPALPALVKMGMPLPVWGELLKYSPLPESAVQKIVDGLKNQPPPPPDPAMVKAQIDAQAKQQDAQMKAAEMQASLAMQEKQMAMEAEAEARRAAQSMEIERAKAALDFEITQQKAQLELAIAAQKGQQQRDIADYQARVNADAQMAKVAGDREAASAAIQNSVAPLADAVGRLVDALTQFERNQQQVQAQTAEMLGDIRTMITAPREAIRDPKTGRVTGSRIVVN